MKLPCAKQFSTLVLSCAFFLPGPGLAQSVPDLTLAASAAAVSQSTVATQPVRAFPVLRLWKSFELSYVGMFSPDASYRTKSKTSAITGRSPGEDIRPAASQGPSGPPSGLPPSMVSSGERVVDDFEPPVYAQAAAEAHAPAATVRNQFLTYAYGRPSVLYAPRHVVSDSMRRLVIADRAGGAVHVLDPKGKTSFRIVCGPGRRIHEPQGVAVDSQDNVYVADSERGLVLVFDRSGNFVREIGNRYGEPEYAGPHGIAIDQAASRLYLSDTPRNLVIVLDHSGHVLKQLGKLHDGSGVGEFDHPTDIAINHKHVFVLDRMGTRVHVLDMAFHPVGSFDLNRGLDMNQTGENGLGADRDGNVYVSWSNNSRIWVFTDGGTLLGSFGQAGTRAGEFASPGGLWIDSSNRLYVADSGNGRVQLFQLESPD